MSASGTPGNFQVDLPQGGAMYLQSAEEVDLWTRSLERYLEDYHLTKTNDLVLLSAILQQQVTMFRAQRQINGMEPELKEGVPTGRYVHIPVKADEVAHLNKMLNTAASEIRSLEKALGIDKATRESGGTVSVENYLKTLKKAAHERGIHISKRVLKYEDFVQGVSWRIRVLRNADPEDRAYHDVTPEKILEWVEQEILALEEADKVFAREKGKLYAGSL